MTSREALQHIINLVSDDTYYKDRLEEEFETLQKDLEFLEIAHNYHEQEKQTKEWLNKQKHWQIVEESVINSLKMVLESLKNEDPKKYLENKIKELENGHM